MVKSIAKQEATSEPLTLERRKSSREDFVVRVEYQTVDELFSEFARNVNEGGLFVESDSPRDVGSRVELQFRLPGSDEPVRAKGTVVHVTDGAGAEPAGMGIEFENLDGPTRQLLNDLVRKLRVASPR
jgi:type IV pilus assembly protein PilZ